MLGMERIFTERSGRNMVKITENKTKKMMKGKLKKMIKGKMKRR